MSTAIPELRGDHHVHSTFSDDAESTLAENIAAASAAGLTELRLIDHVRTATEWVPDFVAAVAAEPVPDGPHGAHRCRDQDPRRERCARPAAGAPEWRRPRRGPDRDRRPPVPGAGRAVASRAGACPARERAVGVRRDGPARRGPHRRDGRRRARPARALLLDPAQARADRGRPLRDRSSTPGRRSPRAPARSSRSTRSGDAPVLEPSVPRSRPAPSSSPARMPTTPATSAATTASSSCFEEARG